MADLVSITIIQEPNKTRYKVGDFFERYGMILRANFSDGTSSNIDPYFYSPSGPLTINDTEITIYFMDKSVTQRIYVSSTDINGYFESKYLGNATTGQNPYINVADGSYRFNCDAISVGKESYKIDLSILYFSRMTDKESDLVKQFYKRFKTNFHQFLIKDGKDNDNLDIYKYIDGNSYVHTFKYDENFECYYDTSECGLSIDFLNRKISDQNGMTLTFDSSGRLISIADSNVLNKVTRIEYNENGIRKIYDERNPNDYIKFSYEFGIVRYIRIFYNDTEYKKLTINGIFGNIFSIEENFNDNTRTIYKFSVNDRDRINRIVNCLTNESYRLTYSFDEYNLNDYIFNSLHFGYMQNDSFYENSKILKGDVNYNSIVNGIFQKMPIIQNNGQVICYENDINGSISSIFETKNSGNDLYSLKEYGGTRLNYQGAYQNSINGKRSGSIYGNLTINEGLSSSAFYERRFLKFCGFIKLNSNNKRVRISFISSQTNSRFVELNPFAINVWQYFEIPFDRGDSSGAIHSFNSFSVSLKNENNNSVVAYIADLHFEKGEDRPYLYFENNGHPFYFYDINRVSVQLQDGSSYACNILNTSFNFTENDLIATLKYKYKFSSNITKVFFNNCKSSFLTYGDVRIYFSANNSISIFDRNILDNSSYTNNKNWYFDSSLPFDDRTYFLFNDNNYVLKTRFAISELDGSLRYITSSKAFDYADRILEEINQDGGKFFYEYFEDGSLKKKYAQLANSSTNLNIYEENRSENIKTISENGETKSFVFNNDLISEIRISPSFSSAKIQFAYDDFSDEINQIDFLNGNSLLGRNTVTNVSNLITTLDDCSTYIKIEKSINNKEIKQYVKNGQQYVKTLETIFENEYNERIYFNNASQTGSSQIRKTYNRYGKNSFVYENDSIKATYSYRVNPFSNYTYPVIEIQDDFANQTKIFWYNSDNEISQISIGDFCINYYDDPRIIRKDIYFSQSEDYSIKQNDKVLKVFNDYDDLYLVSKINDSLGRLEKKRIQTGSTVSEQSYYFVTESFYKLYKYEFNNTYKETYSYSYIDGKLTSRLFRINNANYVASYFYDSQGRLLIESNTFISFNRTYEYCNDQTSNAFGKMIKFGNNDITYDQYGRMSSFGSTIYEYDNYGNRSSKTINGTATTYTYERGGLLSATGNGVSFTYDLDGKRVKKSLSNGLVHKYYYEGLRIAGEDIGLNNSSIFSRLRYFYDDTGIFGFRLIDSSGVSKNYTYLKNPYNVIVGIAEGNSIVAIYVYDAWGNHRVCNPDGTENTNSNFVGNLNPIRYKSYYYDDETSLYYITSRYYDPEIGRFISTDSADCLEPTTINGLNLYAYCGNDPINYIDCFGGFRVPISWIIRYGLKRAIYYFLLRKDNHKMPNRGVPGSVGRIFYPDGSPKQEREYGPDGRPLVDHDHHPGEDVGYDHDHDWDWSKNPPRQPAREPSKIVAALGLIGAGAALIWLLGNDFTGVGTADDALVPAAVASFLLFWTSLFGGSEKDIW
ncbi:MAG: RHS repeat-associated core domain-containing protein [Bacilli bacterium]|nr:RHS repeat-associated core domain-containing protein [Bacilli bacterium]